MYCKPYQTQKVLYEVHSMAVVSLDIEKMTEMLAPEGPGFGFVSGPSAVLGAG